MNRTRTLVLLGITALLGLIVLWLVGALVPGPPGSHSRVTANRGGETALAVAGLLEELQIIPQNGRRAPSFTLDTLEGARFGLADLAGRPALLYFWATW
jgi:cytochrome oxidase Cu insertion factor (SCO1/SenC/PrrC family)